MVARMCATEYLSICTPDGRDIGRADRAVIHRQGLLHRAVHIAVTNAAGEVYLQHRGPHKDEHPDCWAVSVGGHVDAGEEIEETAHRELREELRLSGDLEWIGELAPSAANGGEHVTVYHHLALQEPEPDGIEVTEGRWFTPVEVERILADPDFPTAPSLRDSFRLWCEWKSQDRKV